MIRAVRTRAAWIVAVLTGSACTRDNPGFEATEAETSSVDTDSASASASATSVVSTSSPFETTSAEPPPDDSTGDDGEATTDGQEETGSPVVDTIVFVTQPVPGGFAEATDPWETGIGLCAGTVATHLAGLGCSETWPLLPIDGIPIHEIPNRPGGAPLSEGAVLAPDGTVVAESFEGVASVMLPPVFVDAVTAHLTPDETDLTMWWGQLPGGEPGGTCENWSTTQPTGTTLTLDAAAMPGPPLSGSNFCSQPHHLLCACF